MTRQRNTAFTLVEALATMALASLLVLAGFRVIASVGRGRAAMIERDPVAGHAAAAGVLELVRWDLSNARFVRAGEDELSLYGYNAFDAQTLAPVHRPVRVVYRIRRAGGRGWLVREQTNLDVSNNRNRWTQLVCPDVSTLQLHRVPSPDPRRGGSARTAPLQSDPGDVANTGGGWEGAEIGLTRPRWHEPLPERVRLVVRAAEGAKLSIDQVVYCR